MRHNRLARALLIALGIAVPALAAQSLTVNGPIDPGFDNPTLDATRHAMPPPDVEAKPALAAPQASPAAAPQTAPGVSANPLWAIPLSALAATRNRPLFTPSRRPPAPVIANTPVAAAPPPPPPPAAPEHPNLVLVGTVAGENEGVAVFIDQGTRNAVRLRTGEGHLGWILQSVDRRAVTLHKGDQTETLELPRPTAVQATAPVVTALPPPPPPPPVQQQTNAPPSATAPQPQGCMPEPIGC
jgi:hypothetical protein